MVDPFVCVSPLLLFELLSVFTFLALVVSILPLSVT